MTLGKTCFLVMLQCRFSRANNAGESYCTRNCSLGVVNVGLSLFLYNFNQKGFFRVFVFKVTKQRSKEWNKGDLEQHCVQCSLWFFV